MRCTRSTKLLCNTVTTVAIFLLLFFWTFIAKPSPKIIYVPMETLAEIAKKSAIDTDSKTQDQAKSLQEIQILGALKNAKIPVNDMENYPCLPHTMKNSLSGYVSCVHIFNETEPKQNKQCLQIAYRTKKGFTPMCLYDSKVDKYVSRSLMHSGGWERNMVKATSKILLRNPDMQYLDLGCNIGTYSIAAAKLGHRVVAVDPMLQNLRLLSQSLHMGNIQKKVTLIWNAVSSSSEYVKFRKYKGNVGGTAMERFNGTNTGDDDYIAEAVRLDDLISLFDKAKPLFIKLDIETQELEALLGGQKFLEAMDVSYVQMEFHSHTTGDSGKTIIDIMSQKGLRGYKDAYKKLKLKETEYRNWKHDVYFIKD